MRILTVSDHQLRYDLTNRISASYLTQRWTLAEVLVNQVAHRALANRQTELLDNATRTQTLRRASEKFVEIVRTISHDFYRDGYCRFLQVAQCAICDVKEITEVVTTTEQNYNYSTI